MSIPTQEIRFAVVLNGGVSLAVWMGGAVVEIDRVTRKAGAYRKLLALVGGEARADVIAGTSAGGINGAALALSQINEDADLTVLRGLWARQGDIDALMRTPFQGSPPSLLRGDDYFLPQLRNAFERLTRPWTATEPSDRPVDLTITTTLLHGALVEHVDALGLSLPQSLHNGRFQFRRDNPESVPPGKELSTDFDRPNLDRTIARLALAARSTASFPMAFEPSYIPVAGHPDDDRPDMAGVASWSSDDGTNRSRYVVDGGLLANTPTREALEAIDRMPASGPVRRVMLLVYPHAAGAVADPPDTQADMPTVLETSGLLLGALSSQGSRTFVEEIDRHNRTAAARRADRMDVIRALADSPDDLYATADQLLPLYRQLRVRRAARDLAACVPAKPGWSYEKIRDCAEQAQQNQFGRLPYLPASDSLLTAAGRVVTAGAGWEWGVITAEHVAESALDVLSRLISVVPDGLAATVSECRSGAYDARRAARDLRKKVDERWIVKDKADWTPDRDYWTTRLDAYRTAMAPSRDSIGEQIRQQVVKIAGRVGAVLDELRNLDAREVALAELDPWQKLLGADATSDETAAGLAGDDAVVLGRLLALEVLTTCLAEQADAGVGQPVDLVEISLMARSPFAVNSITPADKGAGLALSRFAGFLKQSWRVNDWIWGRLDAAAILCRTLLVPERLRQIARLSGIPDATEQIDGILPDPPPELTALRRKAIDELKQVYDLSGPAPDRIDNLVELAIWAVQTEIILTELPELAAAASADKAAGGDPQARSVQFLEVNERLLHQLEELGPESAGRAAIGARALTAFDRAGIGLEKVGEEASSNRLLRTAVEAAAVAVTVLDGKQSGLPVLRPVTRALRGAALLPYWAIRGISSGSSVARFLAVLGFSVGGLLVVLALLGSLPGWASAPAAAAGAGALLGAFGYGALRAGTFLHGVVLLAPVVPLSVFALTELDQDEATATRGVSAVVLVAVTVVALIVLGSLPAMPPSPARAGRNFYAYASRKRSRIAVTVAMAAVLGGLLRLTAAVVVPWLESVTDPAGMMWPAAGAVVLFVAMAVCVWFLGRWLGTWRLGADGRYMYKPTTHPAGSAAGWSVVYAMVFTLVTGALLAWAKAPTWAGTASWVIAALVTSILFAVVLLLFVPWFVPWRACVRIAGQVRKDAGHATWTEKDLVDRLMFTDCAYRYFLLRGHDRETLTLTRAGRRLLTDLSATPAASSKSRPGARSATPLAASAEG